jgi:molybdopterin molybdotransferase
MLLFEEALDRVLAAAPELATEVVALADAGGRVLAEHVVAAGPLPAFDTSAMDGYAVNSASCQGIGPFRLRVVGESRAGFPFSGALEGGACRIFTGALLPAGADAVVMQENVDRERDVIALSEPVRPYQHVRRQGETVTTGQRVLDSGVTLNPFHIGLLASVERSRLAVSRAPRVAILATGGELREPGGSGPRGSIPDSNSLALAALARKAGAVSIPPRRVSDDARATLAALRDLLSQCDVLLTIGGVSVGDHDVVKAALERAGVELAFWKVAIKPGKPLAFGRAGERIVFGLPGNPVSAQVTFLLFVLPLLRKMQGCGRLVAPRHGFTLGEPLRHSPGRLGFYPVRLGGDVATPMRDTSSGSVVAMAWADGLAIVSETSGDLEPGAPVEVIRFSDL